MRTWLQSPGPKKKIKKKERVKERKKERKKLILWNTPKTFC
jgi:hypothetical protein